VGQIPREPPGYQPRADLLEQLAAGADTARFTVVQALTGQRGVGKTQLAAAYARACVARDWPLIAWITGEDPDQLVTGLAELAEHLGLRASEDDATTAAGRVRLWLETSTRPGLLVIDNAEDPAHLEPFLPTAGRTHIVITTTNQAFSNTADTVDVTVYTPDEAVAYLTERTRLSDASGAAALAEEVGYLPLALAQIAWLITSQGKSYAQVIEDLRAVPLADLLRPVDGGAYPDGAGETILLTAARVEAADKTGHARTVVGVLALLSPAGIPRTLLTRALADMPGPVDARSSDQILQTLAQASLITYSLNNTVILVHRLTQRALRDRASHDGSLGRLVTDLATALDVQTIDEEQAWAGRVEAAALIDQIIALTANVPEGSQATARPAGPSGRLGRVGWRIWNRSTSRSDSPDPARTLLLLRTWAIRHLLVVGNPAQAISLGEHLVADAATILGPDHPDTYYCRDLVAAAHQYTGNFNEALMLFEAVLADRRRVLKPDHPNTLASRHNLAYAYEEAGQVEEAITLYKAVLADQQRVLKPDHPNTLTTRHNLANAYQAAGEVEEAITLYEALLADERHVLKPDDPSTLITRQNLAFAHQVAGHLDEAITLYEAVLADKQRVLKPDHPSTLTTQRSLACAYQAVRDAEAHQRQVRLGDPPQQLEGEGRGRQDGGPNVTETPGA
jgi:Tetratricopeptide repeat